MDVYIDATITNTYNHEENTCTVLYCFGNECVDIYVHWKGTGMVVDIIVGSVTFVVGFIVTFALYLYDKKKEKKKLAEEKN